MHTPSINPLQPMQHLQHSEHTYLCCLEEVLFGVYLLVLAMPTGKPLLALFLAPLQVSNPLLTDVVYLFIIQVVQALNFIVQLCLKLSA